MMRNARPKIIVEALSFVRNSIPRGDNQTTRKSNSKNLKENMKNLKLKNLILTAALLIIAANSNVFSQQKDSNIVRTDNTVTFLIEQNKSAEDLISKQKNRIADLEAEVAVTRENSASISKSYEAAQSEIASLKTSNAALARAVAINEDTIAKLQADNEKQRDKAKRATRDKWKAIAVASGIIVIKLLL